VAEVTDLFEELGAQNGVAGRNSHRIPAAAVPSAPFLRSENTLGREYLDLTDLKVIPMCGKSESQENDGVRERNLPIAPIRRHSIQHT